MSRVHAQHLKVLVTNPDDKDRRLAHKYYSKLLNVFLASNTRAECVDDNSGDESAVTVSPASQAAMRYLAGMCFAKARYKLCNVALHNMYINRTKVQDARRKVTLLEVHIISQDNITASTQFPETLDMIIRKQNARLGLTHVSDDAFAFFQLFDRQLSKRLKLTDFQIHKGYLFTVVQSGLFAREDVVTAWKNLFPSILDDDGVVLELMKYTVLPYIHVKFNQFRKDMIDNLRDKKTLEIRKAVWNSNRSDMTTVGPKMSKK
jgi:hypothetical protein